MTSPIFCKADGDDMTPVKYGVNGNVATITLADDKNRNALGNALIESIYNALHSANDDEDVRAIVITHEGPVFCAGVNLKERSMNQEQVQDRSIGFEQVLSLIQTCSKPVIAKINGAALGGGIGLACASDISIANEDATFGFTEVRLGVAPAIIAVVCLQKMRRGEATEAFLRGNRFSGREAAKLGIITRAVDSGSLESEMQSILSDILRGGPMALGATKRIINEVPSMSDSEAFEWAAQYSDALFDSVEASEGMTAFLEKRDPDWIIETDS